MNLYILVEGKTEKAVLKDFLAPYCQNFEKIIILNAEGSGKLRYNFKETAEIALAADVNTYVFCLIDLYEAPFTYPKQISADENPTLAQFAYLKKLLEDAIAPRFAGRFFAFPVVMEIETWLLADIEALNSYFKPQKQQELKPFAAPENIAHPAKTLEELWKRFKSTGYDKVLHGERLFRHASSKRVYEDSCPHFELFINKLLELQGIENNKPLPAFTVPNAELYAELARLLQERDIMSERIMEKAMSATNETDYQAVDEIESQIKVLNQRIEALHRSDK